jgi:hypothetical protein
MADLTDWIGLLFIVAVVYILVRPSSKAAEMVDAAGRLLVALVRSATGLVQ